MDELVSWVVCGGCGSVAEVDGAVGVPVYPSPSQAAGFTVDEAEVTFWGVCPRCQANRQPERET
jgi:Fur family transcriptional regulator, stress-responsive regulator